MATMAAARLGMEHEAAEARTDVDDGFARRDLELAAHMLDLVRLRLLERARAFLPVGAGVHHQRFVEPEAVEGRAEGVMEARVLLRLAPGRVGEAQLVPRVADANERVRAIEPAREADDESLAQAALDIDVAREVRLEQPDMSERRG